MIHSYIKKNLFAICVSGLVLVLPSCGSKTTGNTGGYGGRGTFNATDMTDYSNYEVTANLVYDGSHCKVYIDQDDNYMTDSTAAALGAEFDSNIYNKIVSSFGEPSDVDGNGKIIILILNIRDSYATSGTYVAGYFDPVNEYDPSADILTQYSNDADMIYMDSYPGGSNLSKFKETMAHEFQHLINFTQKVFVQGSSTGFDTWVNEGMSSAAEQIYEGSQIQWKINYYNSDTHGDIAKGQRFIAWDNDKSGAYDSVLGNYSTVYLFFQWLRIQASNGNGIFKVIMNDSNVNGTAVFNAAKTYMTGFDDSSFGNLMRDWFITNIISDSSATGYYSYKGEIAQLTNHAYSGSSTSLLPGECIYRNISDGAVFSNSSPVYGAGVSSSDVVSYTSPYSAGTLVVYNSGMNESGGTSGTGVLPSEVSVAATSTASSKSLSAVSEGENDYPIDVMIKIKDFSKFK